VIEKTTGVDVDMNGTSVDIPPEMKDLVLPGGKVLAVARQGKAILLNYMTDKDPKDVKKFYKDKLGAPSSEVMNEGGITLIWDNPRIGVNIAKEEDGKTSVAVIRGNL